MFKAYRAAMRIEIEPGVRLYVDVDGMGLVPEGPAMVERPTVLLLHGGPGMDHSLYKGSALGALTDIAQVVFYDHRSQGRSDARPREEWNLDTWADDVVRLCDALGVEKPIVIGASFGGMVAQRYIARHPEHPAKVVLACTMARWDAAAIGAAFRRIGGDLAGDAATRFFGGDAEAMGDFLEHCIPLYSVEPADPEMMMRGVMNLELQQDFIEGEARTMDLLPGLAKAACPVLVVGGELDPVCAIENSDEIAAALPAELVTLVRVPGASHLEVAGAAAVEEIRRFIASDAGVGAAAG
jgi:proline iminopeptidase